MFELEVPETLPAECLVLAIPGGDGKVRKYSVKPCPAEWWYRFAALRQVWQDQSMKLDSKPEDEKAAQALEGLGHAGMHAVCLGADVAAQMLADGVSGDAFRAASNTAFVWHASGGDDEAAAAAWAAAWSGKAVSPSLSSTSTTTGAAPSTRKRASGITTTSRPKPRRASTRK